MKNGFKDSKIDKFHQKWKIKKCFKNEKFKNIQIFKNEKSKMERGGGCLMQTPHDIFEVLNFSFLKITSFLKSFIFEALKLSFLKPLN